MTHYCGLTKTNQTSPEHAQIIPALDVFWITLQHLLFPNLTPPHPGMVKIGFV